MFKPINGWTREKIIAHVEKSFKGKSMIGEDCYYRGKAGKKCAVGMFIPDDKYHSAMEGKGAAAIVRDWGLEGIFPLDRHNMNKFQYFHDSGLKGSDTVEEQKAKMVKWVTKNVAKT